MNLSLSLKRVNPSASRDTFLVEDRAQLSAGRPMPIALLVRALARVLMPVLFLGCPLACVVAQTQEQQTLQPPPVVPDDVANTADPAPVPIRIEPGTKIPLGLINSVSTKSSMEGDRVYLETVFPVMVNGKIVIPPGSYVQGTVTEVKRPGHVKGRGELFLRFDSLTLPNGITRDFRARVGGIDGRGSEELDRAEGKIRSESGKGSDARTIGETTAAATGIGAAIGAASEHAGMGAGIGAGAGAMAGLLGVLLTRGPDAVLAKGSTIEMVLDRPIDFSPSEVNWGTLPNGHYSEGAGPLPSSKDRRAATTRLPL